MSPISLHCPDGDHLVSVKSSAPAGERFCPEHGCELKRAPKPQRTQGNGKQPLPGEKQARARFRQVVCSKPCYFMDTDEFGERRRPGHTCRFPLDAHHLISKGWIKREIDLPPEELVALMHNPIIGAPLCRKAHDEVEYRPDQYVYWEELSPALIEFCERFDAEHPEQRSLLERLKLECPTAPDPTVRGEAG